jgi:hypothetical protein
LGATSRRLRPYPCSGQRVARASRPVRAVSEEARQRRGEILPPVLEATRPRVAFPCPSRKECDPIRQSGGCAKGLQNGNRACRVGSCSSRST